MRPAFSVIFLTTLIGVGQGLFMALVAGQFYWVIGSGEALDSGSFYAGGSLLAMLFMGAGLIASFFHLAHPERAWRSATRWRTSWLSREVIALPAVMGMIFLYGGLHWLDWRPVLMSFGNMKDLDLTMATGYVGAAAAVALFICTGMIYACMKFIQEWASALTVINFGLMGMASGFSLAAAYAAWAASPLVEYYAGWAIILSLAALTFRVAGLIRNRTLKRMSSLQTAIGVRHRDLRQVTRGFTAGAFNLKEFFHPGGRGLVAQLSATYLICAFILPILLLSLAWQESSLSLFGLAFVVQYSGLVVERWVFFAEARHPQNLYYQKVA